MKRMQKFLTSMGKGKDRALSILNGLIGDTLEEKRVGIATKMRLYTADKKPLILTKSSLRKMEFGDSGKICILAHGSCAHEKSWGFKDDVSTNYGSLLQKDFGFMPLYLRYNSGLHISTNGRRLSNLLESFVRHSPKKVRELILIGHSMGGLIYRSACYYGQKDGKKWVKLITKIFYLGSPHLGTHLARLGKLATTVLSQIPNPVTKMIVSLSDLRSAGVKDLRYGYLTDEDWQNKKSDNLFYWHHNKTPLLKNAEHYLICGTLSKIPGSTMGRLFGDGLVHPASGTGKGLFASSAIPFLQDHCKIILGISHTHLQKNQRVYEQIRDWCG